MFGFRVGVSRQDQETVIGGGQIAHEIWHLRLVDEVGANTYQKKSRELQAQRDALLPNIQACDTTQDEQTDLAVKTFELSQALRERWLTADVGAKRQILEIIGSNLQLDHGTLVVELRKPFDLLLVAANNENGGRYWDRTSDLLLVRQAL